MDRDNPKLLGKASGIVILPIVGMMGGLLLGAIVASIQRADEITSLHSVLRWGVTGFFLGLALVVLSSLSLRRKGIVSLRRLMILVVIAGLLSWYFTQILFGVIGS
jgi:hypothetical protein